MSGATTLARPADGQQAPRRSRRSSVAVLVGLLLLIGAVGGRSPASDVPYDPRSTAPSGLQGVLDVLRELDVEVTIADADDPDATTVLALPGVPEDVVDELVGPGRVVVSTTPPAAFEDGLTGLGVAGVGEVPVAVDCDLLPDVAELTSSTWTGWDVDADAGARCVPVGGGWWLVVDGGDDGGRHVHLADLAPLVNARLDDADGALAAVRLLTAGDDGTLLVVEPGDGARAGLFALVRPAVWDAVWLAVLAFLLVAAARGRRLGAPPDERLPVRVPGALLVRSVGDLRARADLRDATASSLRDHTRRTLAAALRLPADTGVDDLLAAHAAADLPVSADAPAALAGPSPADDEALASLAATLARLRADAEAARGSAPVARHRDTDTDHDHDHADGATTPDAAAADPATTDPTTTTPTARSTP